MKNKLLTKKEVADILRTSTRSVDRMRAAGCKLGCVKLAAKTIRFRLSAIEKLIESRSV